MSNDNLQNYFRSQQVSLQWLPILRAMAMEMAADASPADLRILFFNIGERFAKDAEESFQNVETLAILEDRLNDFWARLNWGWVELVQVKDHIEISHSAAPLAAAFGNESIGWSVGLLEGFYQTVFMVLGASGQMVVRSKGETADGLSILLRFGR